MRKLLIFPVIVLLLGLTFGIGAQQSVSIRILLNHITGLSSPVFLTHSGDGTGRLFVVERGGNIKVVPPGSTSPTVFLNISGRVLSGGERGLLGLAFHPDFENNSYFFVNYTRSGDGATVISRFTATNGNTVGDPNSERILLTIAQPFSNHNGGMIAFDAAGDLHIGMGDGGSGNDPGNRAQNINELLGKMLRITPDVATPPAAEPYSNPPDNPYVGIEGRDEIYAVGVRNPWRWSFDRETGQLWAGDVGQNAIEEVDLINLGGNYGWRVYEGNTCTNLDPSLCTPANYDMPIFTYSHSGGRCSITGGYVYRGPRAALPQGSYLYSDYCTGEMLLWYLNQQSMMVDLSRNVVSFGEDEAGELYIVGLGGTIDKVLGRRVNADFGLDGRTDLSLFRPSNGTWYLLDSANGQFRAQQFGTSGDIPTPEDFDGDTRADVGVFRPSTGYWYTYQSMTNSFSALKFGTDGDIPAASDFDGDGKADHTVFRPSTGVWYIRNSANSSVASIPFGIEGDIPTAADYDGDGKADVSVFRPSTGIWYRLNSSDGSFAAIQFGLDGDIPVAADFDGDGKIDVAVFRPSSGNWYVLRSSDGMFDVVNWGVEGDVPAAGDYDGDGKADIAVFRGDTGFWYVIRSSDDVEMAIPFGAAGDIPAPANDRP